MTTTHENTENERKFVLAPSTTPAIFSGWHHLPIRQGYIEQPRIRQQGDKYLFTFKHLAQDGILAEIETAITETDFNRLWPDCTNRIHKDRFEKTYGDETWVVDFLKDQNNQTYFVLAECEMPTGRETPQTIPDEIKAHIIHKVDRNDDHFTNKNLSDTNHATAMLQWITKM